MEVILLERIERLGQMGDVVNVKPGYARNFLLPQKKALRATKENSRHFDLQRAELEAVNLKRREEAQKVGKKIDGVTLVLVRQAGETGHLYGSVNARDIANEATKAGFIISRQQVNLGHPIKTLGIHKVRVDLHPEVSIHVNANVARSADEAEIQAKTGKAVVSHEEESAENALEAQAEQLFERPDEAIGKLKPAAEKTGEDGAEEKSE